MWGQRRSEASILGSVVLILLFVLGAGCGKDKTAIVQITNKITTLPAGQTYVFTADVQHTKKWAQDVKNKRPLRPQWKTVQSRCPREAEKHWTALCMPSPNRSVPFLRVIGRPL